MVFGGGVFFRQVDIIRSSLLFLTNRIFLNKYKKWKINTQ